MQNRAVITVKVRSGKSLKAFQNDAITIAIQKHGEYDANTLESLREVLAVITPETCLDVGANIGNHAIVIASLAKRLVAFEPVKFIHAVLEQNIQFNLFTNVDVVNAGLSNETATKDIFIPDNGNLGSSAMENVFANADKQEIKILIGDQYLAQRQLSNVDFIKMDVEGHEVQALLGLQNTIRNDKPLLLIEWKNPATIAAFAENDLFDKLFDDYVVYALSYTYSKKVHARSVAGFLSRLFYKTFYRKWCLSNFEPANSYSNIYLVPKRYQGLFEGFRYLSAHPKLQ